MLAGRLKGRVLPRVGDGVRPTSSRVREAVMSMLGQDLEGASVLDLFAGIGGLGVEALSRGAASAVLVELEAGAARRLDEAFGGDVRVVRGDACQPDRLGLSGCYSVVLLDPPWGQGLGVRALAAVGTSPWVRVGTKAVLVHAVGTEPEAPGWGVNRRRSHGDSEVTLMTRREQA